MGTTVPLSASLEDYLEAILHLVTEKQVARSRDIAKRLRVNRSSVTGALQALAKKGLVNYEPYEAVTLLLIMWDIGYDRKCPIATPAERAHTRPRMRSSIAF